MAYLFAAAQSAERKNREANTVKIFYSSYGIIDQNLLD